MSDERPQPPDDADRPTGSGPKGAGAGDGPPPSGPPAGAESYPLEVPADPAPIGADPPAPWPPCPACGAPRRLPEPVCLQCGHDERAGAAAEPARATEAPAAAAPARPGIEPPGEPAEPSSVGAAGAAPAVPSAAVAGGGGGAEEAAGAAARPDAADHERDEELEPLLRPWPGGDRLPWIAAAAVLALLGLVGLTSDAAFPPGRVADDAVGVLERLRLTVRLIAAAAIWAVAAWGTCVAFAWGEDRPIGGRVRLGGRLLLVAALSRLPLALPLGDPLAAFVIEGVLVLLVLAAGLAVATRLTLVAAAILAGLTGLVVGSVALAAHLIAWTLA